MGGQIFIFSNIGTYAMSRSFIHRFMQSAVSSGYSRWGACPQLGKMCKSVRGSAAAKRWAECTGRMRSCWPHKTKVGRLMSPKRWWNVAMSGGMRFRAE